MLCHWGGTGSWAGAWPGQLTRTGQSRIPPHRMSCSLYKLGETGQKALLTAGHGWGISWQVVDNCIVHHSIFLRFTFLSLSFSLQILLILVLVIYYFTLFWLFNCFYLSPWLLISFSWFCCTSHQGREEASAQLSGTCILPGVKTWKQLIPTYPLACSPTARWG